MSDEATKRRSDEGVRVACSPALRRFVASSLRRSVLCILLLPSLASAGWLDANWRFRRPVELVWDAENASGDELVQIDFLTAGHHNADGTDIRVATNDGKLCKSRVLMAGPGDVCRVLFNPLKGERKYFVFFGNPKPAEPPKDNDKVIVRSGLLLEMRSLGGGDLNSFNGIEAAYNSARDPIGAILIDRAFYGLNPFNDRDQWISRITGSLFAPMKGEYTFALSADDKGSLVIDGQPVIFAPFGPNDVRFNKKITLDRGRHDFIIYHANTGGDGRFSVGWQRPDMKKIDIIGRDAFGIPMRPSPGALEDNKKNLTADAKLDYAGEAFSNWNYSHRYKFAVRLATNQKVTAEWDFGDGQKSSANEGEHVFLADGVYPVRLTVKLAGNTDTQTFRLPVSRDWQRVNDPPTDELSVHSRIAAAYDVAAMPVGWLVRGIYLHQRARASDPMMAVASRLAAEKSSPGDPTDAFKALREAADDAYDRGNPAAALALWAKVPADSKLQPRAAIAYAQDLLWWTGECDKALAVIEPYSERNEEARRVHGQCLVMVGRAKDGEKILESVPVFGRPEKRVALAGALARTIEFFIADKDPSSAEDHWERWNRQYPMDFMEGYSVLLRVRIMELRKAAGPAAKVAEAFANAVPKSSYSPQLLDLAAKLIDKTDPAKAKALRAILKQRYPEDPLAQDVGLTTKPG